MFNLHRLVSGNSLQKRENKELNNYDRFQEVSGVWHFQSHLLLAVSSQSHVTVFSSHCTSKLTSAVCEIGRFQSPVINICCYLSRVLIILKNGAVYMYELCTSNKAPQTLKGTLIGRWELMCCLQLSSKQENDPKSARPVSNINHIAFSVTAACLQTATNALYWCEKSFSNAPDSCISPQYKLWMSYVQDITRDANMNLHASVIKNTKLLLFSCPALSLCSLCDVIWVSAASSNPKLSTWFALVSDKDVKVIDTKGNMLNKGQTQSEQDSGLDLLNLLLPNTQSLNNEGRTLNCVVGYCGNINNRYIHILYQNGILNTFNTAGLLLNKLTIPNISMYTVDAVKGCCAQGDLFYIFTSTFICVCNLHLGLVMQVIDVSKWNENITISGVWSSATKLPICGFYSKSAVYHLTLKPLSEILGTEDVATKVEFFANMCNPHTLAFACIKNILKRGTDPSIIPDDLLSPFQNKAFLLSLLQFTKEHTSSYQRSRNTKLQSLTQDDGDKGLKTFYNTIQRTLIQCFCRLEERKQSIIQAIPAPGL